MKGLTIAVISGILSAFFNYGIEAGKPLANQAVVQGCNPLFQNNVTYVVLLWGGLTTNFLWCMYLNARNKTFSDYTNTRTPILANVLFSATAGTMWFLQFFFYGMGESKLGNGASSWITHMATIILTANMWGLYLKEWSGVSATTFRTFVTGIIVILIQSSWWESAIPFEQRMNSSSPLPGGLLCWAGGRPSNGYCGYWQLFSCVVFSP